MPSLSHPDRTPYTGPGVWRHRFALVLSVATLVLLAAGALVVGTGSSLAVPDWPLAYGQVFPPMVGGILFEHGHRLIASTVGLLTVILSAWLWIAEPRRWVAKLGLAAVGIVILQGVLGGIAVLLLLPKPVSISHALLAQLFFGITVILAQVTAPGWPPLVARVGTMPSSVRGLAMATVVLILLTELIGAVVRHNNAGLAIPDFPLAYGGLIPPLSAFPVAIHFAHRISALVVTLFILWAFVRVRGLGVAGEVLRGPATTLLVLLAVQIALGAGVIWSQRELVVTSAHLVNGALLLGSATVLTLRAWVLESPVTLGAGSMAAGGAR